MQVRQERKGPLRQHNREMAGLEDAATHARLPPEYVRISETL